MTTLVPKETRLLGDPGHEVFVRLFPEGGGEDLWPLAVGGGKWFLLGLSTLAVQMAVPISKKKKRASANIECERSWATIII